jgi:CubicO group peptidase (beta-lactamase class C family)
MEEGLVQYLLAAMPFPFSGVIALQEGDGPIEQVALCPGQPAFTVDQPFNILSIGKLFTAIATMQLVEEGRFSLTTPLNKLLVSDELDVPLRTPYLERKLDSDSLEKVKKDSGVITIEDLLSHTAGFCRRSQWDLDQIGTYNYSNYGYQLLARIIGKFAGFKDHEIGFLKQVEKRIFVPAAMEGAIHEIYSPSMGLDCFEVSADGKSRERVIKPEPYPHGNGCLRMTAGDLLAFAKALQNGVLIKTESLQTMKDRNLGFWVDRDQETGSITGYGHPGGGPGMYALLHSWCTESPITAVLLSNYSGSEKLKLWLDQVISLRSKAK